MLGVWVGRIYTKALVLKQFGIKQFVLTTHGLVGNDFDYNRPNTLGQISKMAKAWLEDYQIGRHALMYLVTSDYQSWSSRRVIYVAALKKWLVDPFSFTVSIPTKILVEK